MGEAAILCDKRTSMLTGNERDNLLWASEHNVDKASSSQEGTFTGGMSGSVQPFMFDSPRPELVM